MTGRSLATERISPERSLLGQGRKRIRAGEKRTLWNDKAAGPSYGRGIPDENSVGEEGELSATGVLLRTLISAKLIRSIIMTPASAVIENCLDKSECRTLWSIDECAKGFCM